MRDLRYTLASGARASGVNAPSLLETFSHADDLADAALLLINQLGRHAQQVRIPQGQAAVPNAPQGRAAAAPCFCAAAAAAAAVWCGAAATAAASIGHERHIGLLPATAAASGAVAVGGCRQTFVAICKHDLDGAACCAATRCPSAIGRHCYICLPTVLAPLLGAQAFLFGTAAVLPAVVAACVVRQRVVKPLHSMQRHDLFPYVCSIAAALINTTTTALCSTSPKCSLAGDFAWGAAMLLSVLLLACRSRCRGCCAEREARRMVRQAEGRVNAVDQRGRHHPLTARYL